MTKNIHHVVLTVNSNRVICTGNTKLKNPSKKPNSVRFKLIAKLLSNKIMQNLKYGKIVIVIKENNYVKILNTEILYI